ncbi:DUF928 domain-containing protein [Synechocystis sp. LKSZ1]|uniref:DUF928 domain-containing protein n=1 Tax=Synechocystis sp. LKSZ1 TaxID=3144951 RepID=UPI00336BB3B4
MLTKSIGLALAAWGIWTPMLLASPGTNEVWLSLKFPTSAERGAPTATSGAGTRGSSCLGPTQLQVIAPEVESLTTTSNPHLFVYVPTTTLEEGQVLLVDAQGREVYESTVKLPSQASILNLALPTSVSLDFNQSYTWQFSISCQGKTDYVEANLRRVEIAPTLKSQLAQAKTPLDQAQFYANQQIWQDTLQALAPLQSTQPQEWQELLTSVGLKSLAPYPIQLIQLK